MSRLLLPVILTIVSVLIAAEPSEVPGGNASNASTSRPLISDEISAAVFATLKTEGRSLAAADLDEDGTQDLIAGYSIAEPRGSGGVMAVYRGNPDAIYPNTPAARARRSNNKAPAPFEDAPRYFQVSVVPDRIATADLDADGHSDLVVFSSESVPLQAVFGDGQGELSNGTAIQVRSRSDAIARAAIASMELKEHERRHDRQPDEVAEIRMRLNPDAQDDSVLLKHGQTEPVLIVSSPRVTFTVTTTADDGPGSLREAIAESSGSPGSQIVFNIPGSSPHKISLQSALPVIDETVVIDGTTQPGFAGTPVIEIDGSSVGGHGLEIYTTSCVVRGLIINGFGGNGILLFRLGGHIIEGNFIGTNADGSAARGNSEAGIFVSDSSNNMIGGTTAAARNVVSGNRQQGITIGPQIGVPGTVVGFSTGNRIYGNYIGTDVTGKNAIGNGPVAVFVLIASANEIGGLVPGSGNLISGNTGIGILISSTGTLPNSMSVDGPASDNLVRGNVIGRNADGTALLGNTCDGIVLRSTGGNTVGGESTAERNVITASGTGTCGLTGFDRGSGISVINASGGDASVRNRIASNDIEGNRGLGIDLGADGVTPNDALDPDTGPNELQNYPVLSLARTNSQGTIVRGSLASRANELFTVQLFLNAACDSSGNGEGAEFVDQFDVTTNSSGIATISYSNGSIFQTGKFVTATATDSEGNTSEFSACVQVRQEASDLAIAKTASATSPNPGAGLAYTVVVTNRGPDDASGVIVSDALPVQMNFAAVTTTSGSCTGPPINTSGSVQCSISAIATNSSVTITITVTVSATAVGAITNSASVVSATLDPVSTNNTSSVEVRVNALADLSIRGTPPPPVISPDGASNLPAPGDDITFGIDVANSGPASASNVVMTTSVPANTTMQALLSPSGWNCTAPSQGGTGSISCTNQSFAANASVNFTLRVRINSTISTSISIPNSGQVSSSTQDPVSANNSFIVSTGTGLPGMNVSPTSLDFGTVDSTASADPSAPSRTFTVTNPGTAMLRFSLTSLLRTGADVESGRITTADDRSTFQVRLIRQGQEDLAATFGQVLTVGAGRQQDFRIVFNALIPILAGKFNGLAANQALPDVVTSRLIITPSTLSQATVNLTGRVRANAKLIHPDDPRRAALVTMNRSGTNLTVECAVYDSNQDIATVRYEFLDSAGRTVGDPIDINVGTAISQSQLARGQGFKIEQRFDVPDQVNLARVRVSISDGAQMSAESGAGSAQQGPTGSFVTLSAASFNEFGLAPASIVAGFGSALAPSMAFASTTQLPTVLNGTSVTIRDGGGVTWQAPLFFVSPTQINYQLPEGISPGAAIVTVSNIAKGEVALGALRVADTYPGLFAANSDASGVAAAHLLRMSADGSATYEPVSRLDPVSLRYEPVPLKKGADGERTFLIVYGTGIRYRAAENGIELRLGSISLPAMFSGAQGVFAGLDQVNIELNREHFGLGETEMSLRVDGQGTNHLVIDLGGGPSLLSKPERSRAAERVPNGIRNPVIALPPVALKKFVVN